MLVLEEQPVRAATCESWHRTAGHEVGIGLILAGLVAVALVLSWLPVAGHVVAFVVAGSSGVAASVIVYDALS